MKKLWLFCCLAIYGNIHAAATSTKQKKEAELRVALEEFVVQALPNIELGQDIKTAFKHHNGLTTEIEFLQPKSGTQMRIKHADKPVAVFNIPHVYMLKQNNTAAVIPALLQLRYMPSRKQILTGVLVKTLNRNGTEEFSVEAHYNGPRGSLDGFGSSRIAMSNTLDEEITHFLSQIVHTTVVTENLTQPITSISDIHATQTGMPSMVIGVSNFAQRDEDIINFLRQIAQ